MFAYFDDRQLLHRPERELQNGEWVAHAETPTRVQSICSALGALERPRDHGLQPILAVHDAGYLDLLEGAWEEWRDSGRPGEAIGYTWPIVGRRSHAFERIEAKLGRYSFDAGTPIGPETWTAAYWSAQCAIAAADALREGAALSFALCRPPGHHAGRDYLGGYCYLNNAAIAAQRLIDGGSRRVTILDIDYHHGNGTQDIFYERTDIGFLSLHADPATDYPFFWGHADERGEGDGIGHTLNLPLARETDGSGYLEALDSACETIAEWAPDHLVISFGADTFIDDPISHFKIQTAEFTDIGKRLHALALPMAVIMEGGYASAALGTNVAAFMRGLGAEPTPWTGA